MPVGLAEAATRAKRRRTVGVVAAKMKTNSHGCCHHCYYYSSSTSFSLSSIVHSLLPILVSSLSNVQLTSLSLHVFPLHDDLLVESWLISVVEGSLEWF